MSKKKLIRPSKDAITMIMQRERVPANIPYDTVKSTPSGMDDPSAHLMEYISY